MGVELDLRLVGDQEVGFLFRIFSLLMILLCCVGQM